MSAEGVVLAKDNQVVEELVVAYLVTLGVLVAGTEVDLKVVGAQIAEAWRSKIEVKLVHIALRM
jgi:hypothetical protein